MRLIPLTQGKVALVDDADYAWLIQWKWRAGKCRDLFYAERSVKKPDEVTVLMHRVILDLTDSQVKCDHRDGNGLNNQRYNLRVATCAQNSQNQRVRTDNTSGVRGVRWHRRDGKWLAQIQVNGKRMHLGSFANFEGARQTRLAAELEYHGQFSATLSRKKLPQGVGSNQVAV